MANDVTIEKLDELIDGLDVARSTVYVSATALDHGETDLELQSATALKKAYEAMDAVYDELVAMRNHMQSDRPKGSAVKARSPKSQEVARA